MTGVEMIKKLKRLNIHHIKIKSSHYHYHEKGRVFQVPHHHKELGKGLESAILKAAGLKGESI